MTVGVRELVLLLGMIIVVPRQGYDEPGFLSYTIRPVCPISAVGLQLAACGYHGPVRQDKAGLHRVIVCRKLRHSDQTIKSEHGGDRPTAEKAERLGGLQNVLPRSVTQTGPSSRSGAETEATQSSQLPTFCIFLLGIRAAAGGLEGFRICHIGLRLYWALEPCPDYGTPIGERHPCGLRHRALPVQ
jgi:hypothetical protein